MLKIYNSLTRQKDIFKPLQPKKIKMYVCGVTVYDFCHLGHARTYVAFDLVIRYLRSQGYDVNYVRNITDIDDKIIKRANENNEVFSDLVKRFTVAMHEDFAALNLLPPTVEPLATDYMPQMITMISNLISKDCAYVASNGDVYYDVRRFKQYGCLAHRDIDKLESGARVDINDVKRDPLDFVLWKLAKPNEPHWDSPWGVGRPGWHIECSAMAMELLGETFDIHGGGKDLIFPHHENELAQSEALTEKTFANVWMHTGYLQIQQEKMSKSLGNFLTIRDVLKDHTAEVVRYFLLTSHYRSPLHYTDTAIPQARLALERFYVALRDLPESEVLEDSEYEKQFVAAMDDDFNTPIAFSVLFELAHEIQRVRDKDLAEAAKLGALLRRLGGVMGVLQNDPQVFLQSSVQGVDAAKVESLIVARNEARATKNWAEADRVRLELAAMCVVVEDGPAGTTWKVSS